MKTVTKRLTVIAASFALLLTAATSSAVTITFEGAISTSVNDPNGLFDSVFGFTPVTGAIVTATLTYSPTATPIGGPTPFGPNANLYDVAPTDFTFAALLNGTTPLVPFDDARVVGIWNDISTGDDWTLGVFLQAAGGHRLVMGFGLADSTATWTADTAFRLPEPITAFDSARIVFQDHVPGQSIANIATADLRRVPEPATVSLFGAGLLGFGLTLRRRRADRRSPQLEQ